MVRLNHPAFAQIYVALHDTFLGISAVLSYKGPIYQDAMCCTQMCCLLRLLVTLTCSVFWILILIHLYIQKAVLLLMTKCFGLFILLKAMTRAAGYLNCSSVT